LFFRSEEAVNRWCAQKGQSRGEVLSIETLWALSQQWYHNRLSAEYHGRTAAEVQAIFQQLGLTSDFWQYAGEADAPQK
jgi:hypothetical protein